MVFFPTTEYHSFDIQIAGESLIVAFEGNIITLLSGKLNTAPTGAQLQIRAPAMYNNAAGAIENAHTIAQGGGHRLRAARIVFHIQPGIGTTTNKGAADECRATGTRPEGAIVTEPHSIFCIADAAAINLNIGSRSQRR